VTGRPFRPSAQGRASDRLSDDIKKIFLVPSTTYKSYVKILYSAPASKLHQIFTTLSKRVGYAKRIP
jgi:hypothetical protein